MLSFSVVGCGAAGNKAVIDLMNIGYNPDKCYLINTTTKDLPDEYKDKAIIFGKSHNRLGGCGKERSLGRSMILDDLKSGSLDIDHIYSKEDQAIILVGSTEGGSGSSSIPILAKYFKQVFDANVICVFFFGFNDDVRGIQNTIELCQELSEQYSVIAISNEKFLDKCDGHRFKAEKAANELFCTVVRVLSGLVIIPGSQMIDDTDLFKVATTPGYMIANSIEFSRPKTAEAYNDMLMYALNNQGFVDPAVNPGAKRIALIINAPDNDTNIDYKGNALRKMYGEPYEFFTHMSDSIPQYTISYIISGMNLPTEEISSIYDKYMERTAEVNKSKDDFFDVIGSMRGISDDKNFDMLGARISMPVSDNKKDFFKDFHMDVEPDKINKDDIKAKKDAFEY